MRTTIRVPATTANLGPGFDCLGLALDLWDEVAFEIDPADPAQTMAIRGFGEGVLPEDSSNLVLQAFNEVYHHLGKAQVGVRARAHNGFPIGSGLGSSAAAIAAGVLAAAATASSEGDAIDAFRIAAAIEGHPDNVAAALYGGLTISLMDGDRPVSAPVPTAAGWRVGVVVPALEITTAAMRRALPARVPFEAAVHNLGRTAMVVRAFETGDDDLLRTAMADRLHQPYRLPLIPGGSAALRAAAEVGAAAALSGAGPGLVAFSTSRDVVNAAVGRMRAVFEAEAIETWGWEGGISAEGAGRS